LFGSATEFAINTLLMLAKRKRNPSSRGGKPPLPRGASFPKPAHVATASSYRCYAIVLASLLSLLVVLLFFQEAEHHQVCILHHSAVQLDSVPALKPALSATQALSATVLILLYFLPM
jgi:hypothetical protein